MSLRAPLARARGLGAAGEGVTHWWRQRLTALALVPLTVWFCIAVAALGEADYLAVRGWIAAPVNAVLLIVLIPTTLYHGYLGLQVIVEDYVPAQAWRMGLTITAGFAALVLGTGAVFAVLVLALAG